MFEFQAISVWFGIGVVALTLLRFFLREMSVRRNFGEQLKKQREEIAKRHDPIQHDEIIKALKSVGGWVVPKAIDSDNWGYTLDTDREKQMGRLAWTCKTVRLFSSGRKRLHPDFGGTGSPLFVHNSLIQTYENNRLQRSRLHR